MIKQKNKFLSRTGPFIPDPDSEETIGWLLLPSAALRVFEQKKTEVIVQSRYVQRHTNWMPR